ncbi:MAG: SLBB domain-containing protein [Firmicutes bacterium]|nr:SLBB domain-containing protein [Alicyclobacillaceae bacterium]MCL6496894.1 SLBB domain-containing protein [Bacillota bacterium]
MAELLWDDVAKGVEDYATYVARGGYQALEEARAIGPDAVIARLALAGLRGRGGAAFPTAKKWQAVRASASSTRYLVVNGAEGEPGSFKDRQLMEHRPHLVLEGALIAAETIEAEALWIYVNDKFPGAAKALSEAWQALVRAHIVSPERLTCHLVVETHVYIAGEETALLQRLEGKPAQPWHRPPYPTTRGLFGQPTVVNNVETLAAVPVVLRRGPEWFRHHHPLLFSLSGDVQRPGVYELPLGTPLTELLARGGGPPAGARWLGVLPGGYSMPLVGPEHLETPLDYEALKAVGSGLGASVIALASTRSLEAVAQEVAAFFARETCGKCPVCVRASRRMAEVWTQGVQGSQREELLAYAQRHRHKGICTFLDTASWMTERFVNRLAPEVKTPS